MVIKAKITKLKTLIRLALQKIDICFTIFFYQNIERSFQIYPNTLQLYQVIRYQYPFAIVTLFSKISQLPLQNWSIKHSCWSSIKAHLEGFLEVLSAVQRSYIVQNLLTSVSVEWTTTGGVISGVYKSRKAEGSSLQVCSLLKRNSIRDHVLLIFCEFQSTFN